MVEPTKLHGIGDVLEQVKFTFCVVKLPLIYGVSAAAHISNADMSAYRNLKITKMKMKYEKIDETCRLYVWTILYLVYWYCSIVMYTELLILLPHFYQVLEHKLFNYFFDFCSNDQFYLEKYIHSSMVCR